LNAPPNEDVVLPPPEQIRRAVELYLQHAYDGTPPAATERFLPPADFEPCEWLMSDLAERAPDGAPLKAVRSFALRIGNTMYPHMKLRICRPPKDTAFLFTVDSHDAVLQAAPGTPDYEPLQELKRYNATIADAVVRAWEDEDLPTERRYLRSRIRRAKHSP